MDADRLHQPSSPSVRGAQAGLESLLSGSVSIRSSPFATSISEDRPSRREGDRLAVGRPRRLERVVARGHELRVLAVDADRVDVEALARHVRREHDPPSVRRPRRRLSDTAELRQPARLRAVGADQPELADARAGLSPHVGDPAAVRRPRGLALLGLLVRHATRAGAVGAHDEDPARRTSRERDPVAVGRPRRLRLILLRRRQTPCAAPVRAHRVQVEAPAPLARERDRGAVRRPRGIGLEEQPLWRRRIALGVGEPLLLSSAHADAVDRVIPVARADEHEVWIDRLRPTTGGEQERRAEGEERRRCPHA